MAEGAGFEPAIPFPVYTLSRRAPSTTRPPLQSLTSLPAFAAAVMSEWRAVQAEFPPCKGPAYRSGEETCDFPNAAVCLCPIGTGAAAPEARGASPHRDHARRTRCIEGCQAGRYDTACSLEALGERPEDRRSALSAWPRGPGARTRDRPECPRLGNGASEDEIYRPPPRPVNPSLTLNSANLAGSAWDKRVRV